MNAEQEAINAIKPFYVQWWMVRAMAIGFVVQVLVILSLSAVLIWLLPIKEVKHVLVTAYNKDTQVIKVEPIEKTTYGWNKLMEIYSKQFVIDLHTIDGQTELNRYQKCLLMVEEDVKSFVDNLINIESPNATARKVFESGITRSVNVQRVISLAPDATNTWQVDWEMIEFDIKANVRKSSFFTSIIMAEGQEKTYSAEEEDLNPIGYTVIKYSLRMRNA